MSFLESIRSTLLGTLKPEHRDYLRRNRRRANEVIRTAEQQTIRAVAATVSLLPLHVLARLKHELDPVGALDYAPASVLMGVASPMELSRLRSCAKEPETVAWLEEHLRPGDVFYDVGANVGAYSLVADAIAHGKATIIAIEPSFSTFAQLNHNVFLNNASGRITPLCLAVSSETGTTRFQYSDLNSGAAMHSIDAEASRRFSQVILTVTMDDLVERFKLPSPSLLKVDVDGAEVATMLGASSVLARPELRSILIELDEGLYDTAVLIERLATFGFVETSRHRRRHKRYHNHIFGRAVPRD